MEIGGTAHGADEGQQQANEHSGQKKGNGPVLLFQRKHQRGDHNGDHTKGNEKQKNDRVMEAFNAIIRTSNSLKTKEELWQLTYTRIPAVQMALLHRLS